MWLLREPPGGARRWAGVRNPLPSCDSETGRAFDGERLAGAYGLPDYPSLAGRVCLWLNA